MVNKSYGQISFLQICLLFARPIRSILIAILVIEIVCRLNMFARYIVTIFYYYFNNC